ncbi:hypothetical protein Vadar_026270 [Vaccinium darrowii]|uniref:Uncharacterized protein n=1 Tax=Vaccinium darrowii TaxID=229202 RepID=A0ACB7YPK5_9ERIC|nr:hypothetical protein Vadar_026270 [Vaccinium darrowii]
MDKSYAKRPTTQLPGLVPAVISEEKKSTSYKAPEANSPLLPPNNGISRAQGYQTLGSPSDGNTRQSTNNWKGWFSISLYTPYFNVDTDIVLNRLMSSLYPINGDFFNKVNANPDLYGLIWIATTLVFVIASLGNCATYLMEKRSDTSTSWSFDVSYIDVAACSIFGYVIVVPLGFYFLLQYLGSGPSLVCFWCIWGYSLCIFVLSSFLLVIPVEFVRWTIIIITGAASASFVALNLRSSIHGNDLKLVLVAAFVLQMGLAVFIKPCFSSMLSSMDSVKLGTPCGNLANLMSTVKPAIVSNGDFLAAIYCNSSLQEPNSYGDSNDHSWQRPAPALGLWKFYCDVAFFLSDRIW